MAFWTDPGRQPKLAFQWYMEFGSGPVRQEVDGQSRFSGPRTWDIVQSYTLRSFQRPSYGFTVRNYKILNDPAFRANNLMWNPVEIVLVDGQSSRENNASKLYNMLLKSGYSAELDENEVRMASRKDLQIAALGGQVNFRQIDSDGNTIERWTLNNPIIKGVNFGQANYTSQEIVTLAVNIQYDSATYRRFR